MDGKLNEYLTGLGFTALDERHWERRNQNGNAVKVALVDIGDTLHVEVSDGSDVLYARYAMQGGNAIHFGALRKAISMVEEQQAYIESRKRLRASGRLAFAIDNRDAPPL